jgi:hypothetical protein
MMVVAIASLALSGCGTKTCKSNTVLVDLTLDVDSASADQLTVNVTVDGVAHAQTIAHVAGTTQGNIQIDFAAGYPTGKKVTVDVQALEGGTVVGDGMGFVMATGSCQLLMLEVIATNGGGGNDMSSDMPGLPTDFAGCGFVFVSPSGDDANSGCDPTVPKKTIGAGIGVATAHDVMVCKGTYGELVSVTRAVALRGGYSCSTWTRTATFGYPMFDGVNEAVVHSPSSGQAAVTASASGATVEGFTIEATLGSAMTSLAMELSATGATVKDNKIVAAGTNTGINGAGSVGLDVSAGGNDVAHNLIEGGSGISSSSTNAGSIGVFLGGGSHVHDNIIHPGTGSNSAPSGTGAIGMVVVSPNALTKAMNTAIENNRIESGNGNESAPTGAATIGILITPNMATAIDVIGNIIDAGTGNNSIWGVGVVNGGQVMLAQNRIAGGSLSATGQTYGVRVSGGLVSLVNNEIAGGSAMNAATGVDVGASSVQLRHNTIVSGHSSGATSAGVHINSGVTGTVMVNNLTFGEGVATALLLESCAGNGPLGEWRGNVSGFASVAAYSAAASGTCTAGTSFTTVSGFNTEVTNAGGPIGGSYHLESDCSTFADATTCHTLAGCTASGGATGQAGACITGVLAAYDQATYGVSTLEGSGGWLLKSGTPCVVSQSAINDSSTVTVDWKGTPRASPVSIGAHEFDGTCQ